jgi:hypothetical protein
LIEPATNGVVQNGASSDDSLTQEPNIVAFDDINNDSFKAFKELSNKIGGDVKTAVNIHFILFIVSSI